MLIIHHINIGVSMKTINIIFISVSLVLLLLINISCCKKKNGISFIKIWEIKTETKQVKINLYHNNRVYALAGENQKFKYLYSINSETGKVAYKIESGKNLTQAEPLIHQNNIYWQKDDSGDNYFNSNTGKPIKNKKIQIKQEANENDIIYNGIKIVTMGYTLNAVTIKDDKLVWKHEFKGLVDKVKLVQGKVIYTLSNEKSIYCNDIVTGKMLWKYLAEKPLLDQKDTQAFSFLLESNKLYIGNNGIITAIKIEM